MFERVLIANRGEIAIRIARAAASLGIESVAVYAPIDSLSLHTRFATQSCAIPGWDQKAADPVRAYLDIEAMITIAKSTGCDCVHPGYGFLSENAVFAQRCREEGIAFVGPDPDALLLFGDKVRARTFAQQLGIPVVPGAKTSLRDAGEATALAASISYPVMIKASAGGGGRGMRMVASAAEMGEAFARCQGEAQAAFGDGSVFLEKLITRPRHVEVQVLGDGEGSVVHLHERDCSVQLRNQKVVEVAPAPGLDETLRAAILADAVRLAQAAGYRNAGTVEFLVSPETGEHWFIECNPRIQVEHTITEQVTGVDLVEAQFRLAAGGTLAALGLGSQDAVGAPRGFAVQARVVVQGVGTISAYREPSGPGVRVDACGYLGLAPPPQFDPLLAKVIGQSGSARSFASALERTLRALEEFHIVGVPTNLASLRAILNDPDFASGDARTSLLDERPGLATGAAPATAVPTGSPASAAATGTAAAAAGDPLAFPDKLKFLDQQLASLGRTAARPGVADAFGRPSLAVPEGQEGVECPMAGSVVELRVAQGATVAAGDTLMVISAMKMETAVTAPCSGTVAELQPLAVGDSVTAGQVVAAIAPSAAGAGAAAPRPTDEGWLPTLAQVDQLRELARARLAPGSQDPGVVRQRNRGKLTCRERVEHLLDPGSFREVGSVAGFTSYDEDGNIVAFTPANHVGGWGHIEGRKVIVCADDFTSRGGHADGAIGEKSRHLDSLSIELRVPSIRLLDGSSGGGSVAAMVPKQQGEASSAKESSGAIKAGQPRVTGGGGSFLPGHLGSSMYAEQLVTVPVVNLLMGSVVGLGAAKAVLGHFSVMVRDTAQLFVAGPPVVSHAMGYEVSKEELGGWHIHGRNGAVDNVADTEEDAMAMARRFLSYLPPSVHQTPPVLPPDPSDPAERREEELLTLIPRKRTTTFDVRRAIRLLADKGSFFEIGPLWGTDQVTGFVRFNGHPMGVIASDSRHENGGALTAAGCDKLVRHLDLCNLFHLPVLNLVDNPGFAVGIEHEIASTIRRGGTWMIAFAQITVPIFTVLMRRSFGVAGNNYATPRERACVRVVWPAADVGGIPPEGGIEAAYKRQLAEAANPAALRAEINARIESARGPIGPLNRFQIEEMVDPRETRGLVCEWVEGAYRVAGETGRLAGAGGWFRP